MRNNVRIKLLKIDSHLAALPLTDLQHVVREINAMRMAREAIKLTKDRISRANRKWYMKKNGLL